MNKNMTFSEFLSFFPVVDLPVRFNEETLAVFSKENKVLPVIAFVEFLDRWDPTEWDDMTEIIPCMQLPRQDEFTGIVYWRGGVDRSDFILLTLDNQESVIANKSIASTSFDGNIIKKSVAMIDEDLIIHIIAGANPDNSEYDPQLSQSFVMEILQTGDILFSLDEA